MQESSPLSLASESKKAEQGRLLRPVTGPEAFSVSYVPQTPPTTPGKVNRFIVIHADLKRKRVAHAESVPVRRLSSRVRQMLVILIALALLGATLLTLVPLATSTVNLPSGLSSLISSTRSDWQSLISQNQPQATSTSTSLPPMTIPHSQLVTLAEQDATNAGISPVYFTRQINQESGFNPNAVSPSGAEGIAQFEPSTAAGLGIDPFNPTQALKAAAQMMARYANQYGGYDKALAAYNAGPANLQHAENSCGAKWLSCMPAQTQNYVALIIGN